ncbi:MAG: SBBP repeat-containing protein [Gemmatimonadetes bacterium]|nr:SBBP repeat-containing protein [Gemmatimonadota bacterium]MBK7715849.1 SBBP repeat-containing protein [Gemmatimonadota bacterium]MBK9692258.1 SBBP repeat-containing protein [Gemmatimonadota bacterium]
MSHRVATLAGLATVACLTAGLACGGDPTGGGGGTDTLPPPPAGEGLTMGFVTYAGGGSEDMGRDAATDAQGNGYISGSAKSASFPVTPGSFDVTYNGAGGFPSDAFALKLSPAGVEGWGTFLGGPEYERAYAIEVDDQGYVYLAGRAGSGFTPTAGALQGTFAGGNGGPEYGPQDGFLCKLSPSGASVVFCTYFGNADYVPIRDIAVDANHDIYIVTSDSVGGFPSGWFANAYQPAIAGGRDMLVAKVKGDGTQVLWATYLGGSGQEANTNSIRVDASGVYVDGLTRSDDIPTPNGFDHTLGGTSDIYLAKLSLDGASLLWGTYVGGNGTEDTETHQLALDPSGNPIVVGPTSSSDLPTSGTAVQRQPAGGGTDAMVAKVSPAGALLAMTYLGGSGAERAEGVATDSRGNIYLTGYTTSSNFPTNLGNNFAGGQDLLFAKLSPDLSQLLVAAVVGGAGDDRGRSIIVSPQGTVYLTGQTTSQSLPVLGALQVGFGGVIDAFVVGLDPE